MKAANLRLSISSKAPGVQAGMADAAPKQFQLPSNYMEAFIKGGECTARSPAARPASAGTSATQSSWTTSHAPRHSAPWPPASQPVVSCRKMLLPQLSRHCSSR